MKVQPTRAIWGVLLVWGWCGGASAEMFRCHQPDGSIAFQPAACPLTEMVAPEAVPARPAPQPAPAVVAKPAPAPAAVAVPAKPSAPERRLVAPAVADAAPGAANADDGFVKPSKRKRDVLELSAQFERCRADAPGFAEKSAAIHAAWSRRHASVLAEYGRLLASKVRAGRRGETTLPLHICTDEWLRHLEALSRTPDPRFSTVEKTWQVFMGALMTGDRAAALSCFSGRAEARWKERVDKMADEDLRRIGASIRALKVQWGDDYEKEGAIADTENRVVGIAFRNINEEWKITEFGGAAAPVIAP